MIKRLVYLAGPISGLAYKEARFGWRHAFAEMMPDYIECLSPMRQTNDLSAKRKLDIAGYVGNPLHTPAGITTRDHNDVKMCDAMVACFLESDGTRSLGTAVEFGWADVYRKPIVVIGKADDDHIKHGMLARIRGFHTEDLEEGAQIIISLLSTGI